MGGSPARKTHVEAEGPGLLGRVAGAGTQQERQGGGPRWAGPHLFQLEASAVLDTAATLTSSQLLPSHLLYWTPLSGGCMLGLGGREAKGLAGAFRGGRSG